VVIKCSTRSAVETPLGSNEVSCQMSAPQLCLYGCVALIEQAREIELQHYGRCLYRFADEDIQKLIQVRDQLLTIASTAITNARRFIGSWR
jgi:hypothetical protein